MPVAVDFTPIRVASVEDLMFNQGGFHSVFYGEDVDPTELCFFDADQQLCYAYNTEDKEWGCGSYYQGKFMIGSDISCDNIADEIMTPILEAAM